MPAEAVRDADAPGRDLRRGGSDPHAAALRRWRNLPRLIGLLLRLAPGPAAASFVITAATGLLPLGLVVALRYAVGASVRAAAGGSGRAAVVAVAVFVLAGLALDAGRGLAITFGYNLQERLQIAVQGQIVAKGVGVPLGAFDRGDFYDRLLGARRFVDQRLFSTMAFITRFGANVVQSVALLAYMRAAGGWAPAVLAAGTGLAVWARARALRQRYLVERAQSEDERRMDYLHGLMTGREAAAEIRLCGSGDHLQRTWRRLHDRLRGARLALARREAHVFGGAAAGQTLTLGLVLAAVVAMVARGHLSIGGYAALAAAVRQFQAGLWMLVWDVAIVDRDLRFVGDLFEYLDEPDEAPGADALPPPPLREGVALAGVTFAYPGASRPVLEGVDLRVRPGERVALVGRNGSGKTTLVKLLLGLYRPTQGRVLVDGVDLATADAAGWRRRATAIFQDFGRYHETMRFNIELGGVGDPERAARLAGADEVAAALPRGYDTLLTREFGEGEDISTGQWQRVALARAYARDAELVVLDEPTAALDPRAEVDVYRGFRDAARGRAAVLISHRLGSARLADRIVVLDGGRGVEEGSHEELCRSGGLYAQLLGVQAAWYRDED